jgi:hypothetical protein
MARFRIVRRPSVSNPGQAIYEVEERRFFRWEYRGLDLSMEEAKARVARLMNTQAVKVTVVKEYG